jgi:hypothetical protein
VKVFGKKKIGGGGGGGFWREIFLGGGDLEGKDHYASYNNFIGRMSICIILCS